MVRMDGDYDYVDDNGIHQVCDEYLADNDDDSNDHDDDVDNHNEDDLWMRRDVKVVRIREKGL